MDLSEHESNSIAQNWCETAPSLQMCDIFNFYK